MNRFHTPVLLKEVLDFLRVKKGSKYIDATLGGGGHTIQILERGGILLGIDCDQDAIDYTRRKWKVESRKWKIQEKNLTLALGNFKDIDKIALLKSFSKVSAVLFDLGVSSHQLEKSERGFSYLKTGPLDMRMDKELRVKAADLLSILTKGELYELFSKLGEERFAWIISNGIVRTRGIKPIKTTKDLVILIEEALGKKGQTSVLRRGLIAKRVFQALRIAVNDELNNLKEALPKAYTLLEGGGRLMVISFHSLEDRIVKNAFKDLKLKNIGKIITKKPVVPSIEEITKNSRSKSAKLRVFERI